MIYELVMQENLVVYESRGLPKESCCLPRKKSRSIPRLISYKTLPDDFERPLIAKAGRRSTVDCSWQQIYSRPRVNFFACILGCWTLLSNKLVHAVLLSLQIKRRIPGGTDHNHLFIVAVIGKFVRLRGVCPKPIMWWVTYQWRLASECGSNPVIQYRRH